MTDEVWQEGSGPVSRASARLRDAAVSRISAARARWRRPRPGAPLLPGRGPAFVVDSGPVPLTQLEAILFNTEVCDAIERNDRPFPRASPPPPRVPTGAGRFGGSPRARPARLYDIAPIALELDLLELRLSQLYDVIDRFIVVEARQGFGGPEKPLFLQRNLARFDRFRDKLVAVALDAPLAGVARDATRTATDFRGEVALRNATWRAAREHIEPDDGAIVIWGDLDELPSRDVLHWIRHYETPLPLRLRTTSFRYHFGWRDPDVTADVVAFSAAAIGSLAGHRLRHLEGPILGAHGAVHLTSFLTPLALIAKFAMTTDWDPGILPFVRNEHDETASMIAAGHWFGRPLQAYDAQHDPDHLVPWAARAHRDRFARFWPSAG
jgi:hypothetical protein